jgi:hypothetical protein
MAGEECMQSAIRLLKDERLQLWSEISHLSDIVSGQDSGGLSQLNASSGEACIRELQIQVNGTQKIQIVDFQNYEHVRIFINLRAGDERAMVLAHGLRVGAQKEVVWLRETMMGHVELIISMNRSPVH